MTRASAASKVNRMGLILTQRLTVSTNQPAPVEASAGQQDITGNVKDVEVPDLVVKGPKPMDSQAQSKQNRHGPAA